MHELHSSDHSQLNKIICYGLSDLDLGRVKELFNHSHKVSVVNNVDSIKEDITSKTSTLVVGLTPEDFTRFMSLAAYFHSQWPSLPVIVRPRDLNVEQITKLVNEAEVLSLLTSSRSWSDVLQTAHSEYEYRVKNQENLQLLKIQNQKLESLNANLETLVLERTSTEFEASQDAEKSLKEIQQILSFIKKISACDSLEDVMQVLNIEFKKFLKSHSPILILSHGSQESLYYFQGRQLVSKRAEIDIRPDNSRERSSVSTLRKQLSNTFGRPVGQLQTQWLEFQSDELSRSRAFFAVEHAYPEAERFDLTLFAEQRWPIVTMALENILLKESLQSIAKQWARTFNQMKDPILIIDQNYRVSLSNRDYHRQSASPCYETFAKRQSPCRDCPMGQTFATGKPQSSDISLSGTIYRVHSYPIHLDDQGQISHVINQYTDVTSHVNLRSQVIQGEKMAAVGLLAGNIAHELNNPLTGIHSLSSLLLTDFDENTPVFKDLNEIKEAAARCQRIIRDLLDFSSLGQDGSVRTLDFNEVIEKTLPLLKVSMRTINTDIQLSSEPLWVQGAAQLMQQVIFNLVNNACQAMGEGDSLHIWSERQSDFALVGVRDTGPGIPEAYRAQIFEPFFTTKETGQGTGLGLSMSRSVVERFGGQLQLNEGYKDGTEFIIRLPLVKYEDTHS